jgi:hypothetical protein
MMEMMKRIVITGIALLAMVLTVAAQDDPVPRQVRDSYDPLVPQLFAVDNKNNIFAGISKVDNSVDLMCVVDGKLQRYASFQVDVVRKRHDTHYIYRPKSVAIYEGYVVVLASHRDSCFLAVLDSGGRLVRKLAFAGAANAFSYSPEARELYISGDHAVGYDLVVLDASNGIQNISLEKAPAFHYQKPKMAEKIAKADPFGIGVAMVAMSVVFLGLLLLYLVFKNTRLFRYAIKILLFLHLVFKNIGKRLIFWRRPREKKRENVILVASEELLHAAAVAAAIHLYNEELHDEENAVLTINRISRAYSPWSSKIHGLNTYFNKTITRSKHEKI